MKFMVRTLLIILLAVIAFPCKPQKMDEFKSGIVYESDNLIITQIAKNSFKHTSFLQTDAWGKVPSNGLVVRNKNEAIVLDTPTNDKSSEDLINWISGVLKCKIIAIIPSHFHEDCLGGLKAFDIKDIPSFAHFKTIELAKKNDLVVPKNGFEDSLTLKVGSETITIGFFGEGHTKDNVVGYYPSDSVLFGGCLIKELGASKGYLGDANVGEWSATVENIKNAYPNIKAIVPGHGKYGDITLLDYTIDLFKPDRAK